MPSITPFDELAAIVLAAAAVLVGLALLVIG